MGREADPRLSSFIAIRQGSTTERELTGRDGHTLSHRWRQTSASSPSISVSEGKAQSVVIRDSQPDKAPAKFSNNRQGS